MQGSARKDVVFGQRGCILSPYQGQNGNPGSKAKAEQHRAAIQKAKDQSEDSLKERLEGDISAKEQDETDAATKHETLQADLDKLDAEIKEALRAI